MNDRLWRWLAVALLGSTLCAGWAHSQDAEQGRARRIGWLSNGLPPPAPSVAFEGLGEGLRELGYREGDNLRIETRFAAGQLERLPALARELVALHVEVIVTGGEQALTAAKQATMERPIPIVVNTCDPLNAFMASLAKPGGSATGNTCISAELAGKRLELLKELVPGVTRIGVLYNPGDSNKLPELRDLKVDAGRLRLDVAPFEARQRSDLEPAFAALRDAHAQAIVILSDALTVVNMPELARLTLAYRLPSIFGFREFADAGGLVTYGASLRERFKGLAVYVDKILKGAKPAELPVELPTKFELVINLKTAKALGLAVPPTLLARADEVIE